ncbi:MAG: tetratricopeptide repeat protein, partial [Gammaproteobacteria bacterium]
MSQVSNKTLSYEPVKIKTPSREDAINNYRSFLKNAENKAHFGDALRRLADLELENAESKSSLGDKESTIEGQNYMLSSIQHYKTYLDTYPEQKNNDLILYQLAKAYSLIGDEENALNTMNTIIHSHPDTKYIDEVQFRRGEILFVFGDFREAELAYQYIVNNKIDSIYYEKSLYKLGWSQFKQSKYQIALVNFFNILDRKQEQRKILADGLSPNLSQSEKDFLNDCLRVISFTFSYNDGTNSIQQLFSTRSNRVYKPLLYKQLGQLYLKKDRIPDAAEVFLSFSNDNRHDQLAPDFHVLAIDAYKQGNFHDKVLKLKKQFVEHYGVGSKFWLAQTGGNRYKLNIQLKSNIRELAYHYHALARKSKKPQDFNLAAHWYQVFLRSFPASNQAPLINFLLADSYFDAQNYNQALKEYEKTAYQYSN